jgi:PKD repeat protein
MKQKHIALLLFFSSSILSFGQSTEVEFCSTHKKLQQALENSEFRKQYEREQEAFEAMMAQKKGEIDHTKNTIYTIPVVFHVLHNGGTENISKAQILSAIDILNRDYAMLNPDTALIQAPFQSLKSKADIRFALATIAPDGTCFSGITRTLSPLTSQGEQGYDQVAAIVSGNDVYQGSWPGNKYLNIFVCKDIGGAAGYTNYPSNWSATQMTNGIWVLSNYVGNIGSSTENTSRTLTHEVGHWLNLAHLWGSTNNPNVSCGTDNVDDTPSCKGTQSCIPRNSCSDDNAYWGFDQIDNIENYMEYSYCSKMFTIGQVARMRAALQVASTGRANVVSAANLTAVGANAAPALCDAKFSTPQPVVCVGSTIQFTDESFNLVNGWNWSFSGGTPATSTIQNPTVTYNTPGTYAVQLIATDGNLIDTTNLTQYITVLPNPTALPYFEDFETQTGLNSPNWFVDNPVGNGFVLTTNVGHSGTKSAKLRNFGEANGNLDELTSGSFDLSGITSVTGATLSFRYAFRKATSNSHDYLKVFASNDCGQSWTIRKTISSSTLSQGNVAPAEYTPASISDWGTYHVTNISSEYWNSNFKFKFQFVAGEGNNLYLDDINLYAGPPSDVPVLALSEGIDFQSATVYPNPSSNEFNVIFQTQAPTSIDFTITDLSGKVIQTNTIQANSGVNTVNVNTQLFAKGIYMVQLKTGEASKTLRVIKQ